MANLWRDMQSYMNQKKTDDIFKSIGQLQAAPLAPPTRQNLGEQMGIDAGVSFAPSPVVSSVDQDKHKYYSTLVEMGVDQRMAREIAGIAAPVKEYIDIAQGKAPFAQGDSWNISGTPFGSNPHATGIWNFQEILCTDHQETPDLTGQQEAGGNLKGSLEQSILKPCRSQAVVVVA